MDKHDVLRGRALRKLGLRSAPGLLLLLAALAACRDEPTASAGRDTPGEARDGRFRVGYVLGNDGQPVKIRYEVVGADAVVDGDVVIGAASEIPVTAEAARAARGGARLALAVSNSARYWPNGQVPYVFKEGTSATTQDNALAAMERINRRIDGITFLPATDLTQQYILIRDDDNTSGSCRSEVGRSTSTSTALNSHGVPELATTVNILGCGAGTTSHELMHALGFHHEQKRCDRDDYIDITSTLAGDGGWSKLCSGVTYDSTSYDLLSVMHYDPETGFNGSKVDLWLRYEGEDASSRIGQRDSLSNCDNYALDQIYPSSGTFTCDRPYTAYATYHASYWTSERGFIVDDDSGEGFTIGGTWNSTSSGDLQFDNNYHYTSSSGKGWYPLQVPSADVYNLYAWTFQRSGTTPGTAVYTLYQGTTADVQAGTASVVQSWSRDQTQGSRWVFLGRTSSTLPAGTYTLQVHRLSGTGTVVIDGIRVVQDSADPVN